MKRQRSITRELKALTRMSAGIKSPNAMFGYGYTVVDEAFDNANALFNRDGWPVEVEDRYISLGHKSYEYEWQVLDNLIQLLIQAGHEEMAMGSFK